MREEETADVLGLNSTADTFKEGEPNDPGAGDEGRLSPIENPERTEELKFEADGPVGVVIKVEETVRCHGLGETRGLMDKLDVTPSESEPGTGLGGIEPKKSLFVN